MRKFLCYLALSSATFIISTLWADEGFSSESFYEVASSGAPITGPLVEGCMGAVQKGCRHRFYSHSSTQPRGFIGSQTSAKPLCLKDQPGVFPAPAMGEDSISFHFISLNPSIPIRPVIVRPDGTVFQGLPMSGKNSTQTLAVSSPAQTGVYTLFILSHQNDTSAAAKVEASISTRPRKIRTFFLKSFDPGRKETEKEKETDLFSAEFLYKQ